MKDSSPFGLGGIRENWKDPTSGEWIRTFAIITTDANELVVEIHDRMPLILRPCDYDRWLGDEPDPRELMRSFPAAPSDMVGGLFIAVMRGVGVLGGRFRRLYSPNVGPSGRNSPICSVH